MQGGLRFAGACSRFLNVAPSKAEQERVGQWVGRSMSRVSLEFQAI